MDYMREINAFYVWVETNELSHPARHLWHALMHVANRAGWQVSLAVPMTVLEVKTGMNPQMIKRARNELKQAGRIDWKQRSGNQCAIYSIVQFAEQNKPDFVPQIEPQSEPQPEPQPEPQIEPIYNTSYPSDTRIKTKTKTKTNTITDSAEQSSTPDEPPVFFMMLNDGSQYGVAWSKIDRWSTLYPAVDVMQALRSMCGWLDANPKKRKTKSGIERFITSWLAREQDRGGSRSQTLNHRQGATNNPFVQIYREEHGYEQG